MNGNRGAKGSINDRIISLLYRLRYNKKVKEEEFTKEEKEKQLEYLKRLKQLEETQNINILDDKDKNILDDIEYNVSFKVENMPKNNIRYKTKKVGIDNELKLKLYNIEFKDYKNDEKVNIKKEINKTKNEAVILDEVNKFIKKSLENIEDINNELNSIKEEAKNKNKDTKELEERYKKLRDKVNKLKEQYDVVKNKYDLSEFKILESIKLIDNIRDYKSVARLNEMEMMLKVCKKEINEISGITIISTKSKKVGIDIEDTKKEQTETKIKFKKSKEKVESIKDVKTNIERELEEHQKIINELYSQAEYFKENISKKTYYEGYSKLIGSMFKIVGGILTIPLSGKNLFGMALGNTMVNKGLKQINNSLEKKEKIVVSYDYKDVSRELQRVNDKLEYTSIVISDSLNEIKKLKENFTNDYKKFNNILPEYEEIFSKINSLEQSLNLQQEKISNMNKQVEKEKEINNQKMKKIERV